MVVILSLKLGKGSCGERSWEVCLLGNARVSSLAFTTTGWVCYYWLVTDEASLVYWVLPWNHTKLKKELRGWSHSVGVPTKL